MVLKTSFDFEHKVKNYKNISIRQVLVLFVCLLTIALSWHNCLADECKYLRFYGGCEPDIANPKHPALRKGIKGIKGIHEVIVKHRSGYSIGFSTVVCQSVWVAYRLTKKDVELSDKNNFKRLHYHIDPDLSKYFVSGAWPSGGPSGNC